MNRSIRIFLQLAAGLWVALMLMSGTGDAAAQATGALSTGQQPPSQSEPASAATQTQSPDANYILGPEDVVEVSVLGRTDFTARSRVAQDGTIQLPLLGVFPASNRTTRELSDQVAQALEKGGYYSHPIVKVDIVGYASRYVIVLGAVGSPGLVPIDKPYRLSEILARVGGVKEGGSDYVILRSMSGPERRLSVRDLATGDSTQDPQVLPGDKIYAPTADVFYISGQIKAPGAYPVASDMTLRMAIARGGGLTDLGSDKRVQLTRKGVRVEKPALEGKIEPGDVIVIGERLF